MIVAASTKKYRVKPGNVVQHSEPGEKRRDYKPGHVIELEPEHAEKMPWAVEELPPAEKGKEK